VIFWIGDEDTSIPGGIAAGRRVKGKPFIWWMEDIKECNCMLSEGQDRKKWRSIEYKIAKKRKWISV
jgi:hypothetical protein